MKILLIIVLVPHYFIKADFSQCIFLQPPKTRQFQNLLEYQSNGLPFNPRDGGFLGNYVEFTFQTIDRLPRNAFNTYQSNYVVEIYLNGKAIETIDDGAFNTLFCLQHLNLADNKLRNITEQTFIGLETLMKLNLSGNSIEILPEYAFANLHMLDVLDLSNNNLKRIEKFGLHNATTLSTLYLGGNKLKNFPDGCFEESQKLKVLDIHSNYFLHVNVNKLKGLSNLEMLNVSSNQLIDLNFLSSTYIYEQLAVLDLSNNDLSTLNFTGLRQAFPNLNLIDLNLNKFYCTDLENIAEGLHRINIKLIQNKGIQTGPSFHNILCRIVATTVIQTTTLTTLIPKNREVTVRTDTSNQFSWTGVVVCILGGFVIFILIHLAVRAGFLHWITNRVRRRDGDETEYISLKRTVN